MDRREIIARVTAVIESLQPESGKLPGPSASAIAAPSAVEKLPAWVARFGLLLDGSHAWLFCEPHCGADPDVTGQVLLRIPAGRYLSDTIDIESGTCVSRESAAGDPLVAGLPFTGGPVLLQIKKACA